MIKFKEFDVGDNNYEEQLEQFQTEHPTGEFVQITGGYTSYEKIWFKYEPSDTSDSTDKLSVEKLQEHLLPYKKEMVQKIRDEKMQLVTADEFVKLHKESLTAIRENDKLQEQLDTAKKYIEESYKADKEDNKLLNLTIEVVAKLKSDNETLKKALTEIAEIINDDIHKCDYGCDNNCELNGSLNIYSVENVQSVIDSALAAIGNEGSGDE
ncbi:hypothetical protein [Lactococcus lactis]|uniref:hypothetical protein n=1 Tax=Lactococcus lactis TaxID=1358 RepID=UPI00288E3388|nr:hypothetical protein [Lactococcus lactis]MDT2875676.1 hypothetical protein [Lactococcus lactis]